MRRFGDHRSPKGARSMSVPSIPHPTLVAEDLVITTTQSFLNGVPVGTIKPANLTLGAEIGRGASCQILAAEYRVGEGRGRKRFAVKRYRLETEVERQQLCAELRALAVADCPCIVRLHGAFEAGGSVSLVLELMDRGGLDRLIAEGDPAGEMLPEDLMAGVVFQIFWGLAYLHFERRLHRDIKPQNILLNGWGEVKLADLGVSRELPSNTGMVNTMAGTARYMSPERLAGMDYGIAADVWSVGIVLLELATRRPAFSAASTVVELHDLLNTPGAIEAVIRCDDGSSHGSGGGGGEPRSKAFRESVAACLELDPARRGTTLNAASSEPEAGGGGGRGGGGSGACLFDMPWLAERITRVDTAVDAVRRWMSRQEPEGRRLGDPLGESNRPRRRNDGG